MAWYPPFDFHVFSRVILHFWWRLLVPFRPHPSIWIDTAKTSFKFWTGCNFTFYLLQIHSAPWADMFTSSTQRHSARAQCTRSFGVETSWNRCAIWREVDPSENSPHWEFSNPFSDAMYPCRSWQPTYLFYYFSHFTHVVLVILSWYVLPYIAEYWAWRAVRHSVTLESARTIPGCQLNYLPLGTAGQPFKNTARLTPFLSHMSENQEIGHWVIVRTDVSYHHAMIRNSRPSYKGGNKWMSWAEFDLIFGTWPEIAQSLTERLCGPGLVSPCEASK